VDFFREQVVLRFSFVFSATPVSRPTITYAEPSNFNSTDGSTFSPISRFFLRFRRLFPNPVNLVPRGKQFDAFPVTPCRSYLLLRSMLPDFLSWLLFFWTRLLPNRSAEITSPVPLLRGPHQVIFFARDASTSACSPPT